MRSYDHVQFVFWIFAIASLVMSTRLASQTLTTGDIVGRVTDSSGAVVPDVTVIRKSDEKSPTLASGAQIQAKS